MKTLKLITIGILLLFAGASKAQVSVNVNIGSPPLWGPVGYTEVRYYYLPDVEAYYDVQTSMFIYFGGGVWVRNAYLPAIYRDYDLYSGYKVVMVDYRGNTPYYNFKEYKVKYAKGYHGGPQKTIGQNPGRGNSKGNNSGNGKVGNGNHKSVTPSNGGKPRSVAPANNKPHNNGGGKGKKK